MSFDIVTRRGRRARDRERKKEEEELKKVLDATETCDKKRLLCLHIRAYTAATYQLCDIDVSSKRDRKRQKPSMLKEKEREREREREEKEG